MWTKCIAKDGYAILPDLLPRSEILELEAAVSNSTLRRTRAGIRHALGCAGVADLARSSPILEIAREVLGKGAVPFRGTFFDKSPDSNWLVTWHQDRALPLKLRTEVEGWGPWSVKEGITYAHAPAAALEGVLALRIHLDDSTLLNGPLRMLPATHQLGVLDEREILKLADEIEPANCLVPAGGILAMRPLVVHASSKSQTEMPRRVLHVEYADPSILPTNLQLAFA